MIVRDLVVETLSLRDFNDIKEKLRFKDTDAAQSMLACSRPHARPSQGRPTVACILRVLVLSARIMRVIPSAQVSTAREG